MATFVTMFAATQSQLDQLLPGWPRPDPVPLLEPTDDDSMGKKGFIKRWTAPAATPQEIDPPSFDPDVAILAPVLPAECDFEQDMEDRAPAAIRALPHACLKNLFGRHLGSLAALLVGRPIDAPPERVTPDGFPLDSLPHEAVVALAACGERDLAPVALQWAGAPASGFEGEAEALWVLRRMHALARLCVGSEPRALCLWLET